MITGIGLDIIEVGRVARLLPRRAFLEKIYTQSEQDYIEAHGAESAAGIFAAKEACAKALGTGFRGFSFRDVEVLHDAFGKPKIKLHGKPLEMVKDQCIHISITHIKSVACAQVIIEKL